MLRAHSLLYAIFICLVVSVLCCALLSIASLYDKLNRHFILHDELYAHNQSLVNFASSHLQSPEAFPDEDTLIKGTYTVGRHGLLPVLVATSSTKTDTVRSAWLLASASDDKTCVFIPRKGQPLAYSGRVMLEGTLSLPSAHIRPFHIAGALNELKTTRPPVLSPFDLPRLAADISRPIDRVKSVPLGALRKKDSLYYNSFLDSTRIIEMPGGMLARIHLKGNIVIRSADSIRVSASADLTDVVLVAPKVSIESGFKGSVQVFATSKIEIAGKVILRYPSALCLVNTSSDPAMLRIGSGSAVYGAVVLCGNAELDAYKNTIEIAEGCDLVCDLYCSGQLDLKSDLWGSVYTAKFNYRTLGGQYENCIANVRISPLKRPPAFMSFPLFENTRYGLLKKIQ